MYLKITDEQRERGGGGCTLHVRKAGIKKRMVARSIGLCLAGTGFARTRGMAPPSHGRTVAREHATGQSVRWFNSDTSEHRIQYAVGCARGGM